MLLKDLIFTLNVMCLNHCIQDSEKKRNQNQKLYYYFKAFVCSFRAIDVENAIKLASADDGFVTYEELRENLRK